MRNKKVRKANRAAKTKQNWQQPMGALGPYYRSKHWKARLLKSKMKKRH